VTGAVPRTPAAVSACVIACDDEDRIRDCLQSLSWVDECIVVVDDRSRDATEAIAREFGARVRLHRYEGNIEQKNFTLGLAKCEWVLALDADEVLSNQLIRNLRERLMAPEAADGYELPRVTFHLGRWIRHGDFYPDRQLRLFRRACGRFRGSNPHGRVRVAGRVERIEGDLLHYSYRDLADQLERIRSFSAIEADAMFRAGRPARLRDLVLRPPARFLRAYLLKAGFRDGWRGFVIAGMTAFHVFLKYALLFERSRGGGDVDGA
jgi:glycosyltransferase involved in cell wall biosynthesis